MPYEILVQQAHNIIDEIPHEKIEYVVQFLINTKNFTDNAKQNAERKAAGKDLLLFAGKLRANIDEEKELNDWRAEKFGTAH